MGGALTSASGAEPPPRPVALYDVPGNVRTNVAKAQGRAASRTSGPRPRGGAAPVPMSRGVPTHRFCNSTSKASPLSTTRPRCFPGSVMLLVRPFGKGDGGVRDWNVLEGLRPARIGAERRRKAASKAGAGMTRGERGELRRRWLGSVEASQAGSVSSAWKGSTPVRRTARRRRSSSQARRLPSWAKNGRAPKRIRRATDSLRRTSTPPPGATV